ncbi:MAG TPA: DUF455 family protein [Symbiobacteriaceae bacterium]|nr:DUF455 family protein [Symbiobacteriaceae bacterium]
MIGRTHQGAWGVEATAARLADIHGALLCSLQCLGAWIAGVPQLETKLAMAYHLYDHAHLADQIGRRIYDLTAERPQVPSPANRSLLGFLEALAALQGPGAQTAGLYQVLLPAVLETCREVIEKTNPVADEPTVRILHSAAEMLENQLIWAARQPAGRETATRLRAALAAAGGLHGPGPEAGRPPGEEFTVRPHLVDKPARDERFAELPPGKKMPKAKPLETPEGRVRLLHIALINLEVPAIEVCGRMIAEFPAAPWELKLDLATQIWDEARHAVMCADRLADLGGTLGQYPCHHKVWEHAIAGQTLAERFVTTQRIHEGNGLDQTLMARDALAAVGDQATSQIMDFIMADEVLHVRSGVKWVERLVPDREERARLLRSVEERLGIAAVAGPPLNREGRRKAGFSEVELDWLTAIRERRGEQ